jgi:hypothetical protein
MYPEPDLIPDPPSQVTVPIIKTWPRPKRLSIIGAITIGFVVFATLIVSCHHVSSTSPQVIRVTATPSSTPSPGTIVTPWPTGTTPLPTSGVNVPITPGPAGQPTSTPATVSGGTTPNAQPTATPSLAIIAQYDNKASWVYTGAWAQTARPICIGGTCTWSNTPSNAASLKWSGRQIKVYAPKIPRGGIGNIQITNSQGVSIAQGSIDFYAADRQSALAYVSPVLPNATYTITVTVTGNKDTASLGYYVLVDYAVALA